MLAVTSPVSGLRFLAFLLAGCVALAVLGFELFAGLTAPRLALVLALASGALALSSRRVQIYKGGLLQGYFLVGSMFFLTATVSYVLVGGSDWAVFSWFLMALLGFFVCLGFLASDFATQEKVFELLFLAGVLFFIVLVGYCLLLGIFGRPGYYFRMAADEFATVGLNRVVNAMVFFSGVAIVIGFDKNASLYLRKIPALLMLVFMLYFCFSAGARQGIVGVLFFLVCYLIALFLREGVSGKLTAFLVRFLLASVLVGVVGFFLLENAGADASEWFLDRFLGSVESQGSSGDRERLDALNATVEFAFRNYGFGVGLGNFKILHGIEPHNGYMGLFAEIGIYLFLFNAIVLFAFLFRYYFLLRVVDGRLGLFLMAYLPVHFLFLLNVKDLLREPFTWALLGAVGVVGCSGRDRFYSRF